MESGRTWRYMLEKASIATSRLLRAVVLRAHKGEEISRERSSLLRDDLTSHKECWQRWTVKAILMRSQTERRNMLLNDG